MKKIIVLLAALLLTPCAFAVVGKSSASITIASVVTLSGVHATNSITVSSTSTLKNTYIDANGKRLRNAYEWKTGATTAATATNLAAALNRITGITASATGSVVYATATVVGTTANTYTLSAYGSGLTVAAAKFSGGVAPGYLSINGKSLVVGTDCALGETTAAMAANLSAAINADPTLSKIVVSTQVGAVVYATSTQVGSNAYPLVGYPANKIVVSSNVFLSGGTPTGEVTRYQTIVADKFYGDGSGLTGIAGADGVITGVTAGTGLSGGGTSGALTLNVVNGVYTSGSYSNPAWITALSADKVTQPFQTLLVSTTTGINTTFQNPSGTASTVRFWNAGGSADQKGIDWYFENGYLRMRPLYDSTGSKGDAFNIDPSGKVGIFSSFPSEVLDVTGNAKVSGDVESTAGTFTWGGFVDVSVSTPTKVRTLVISSSYDLYLSTNTTGINGWKKMNP